MNYLAHSFLSFGKPSILVGNIIADLIRKKDEIFYSSDIQRGIHLHRRIDHFTDEHPLNRGLLNLFYEDHGKYASVLLDVYWDYYLAKHWGKFSDENIKDFTSDVYSVLNNSLPLIQVPLQNKMKRMISGDFLLSCENLDRLHRTFIYIEKRTKFESNFDKAVKNLVKHNDQLEDAFLLFFDELLTYTNSELKIKK